jgi:hypothetical protein
MKQINLVPLAVRQKAVNRQTLPYLVLAALIGLAAAGAAWGGFSLQVRSLKATKDSLTQQEAQRAQAAAKDSASLQVNADLLSRVNTLNTLAKADVDWNKAFQYVTTIIPKDVTLQSYSVATAQGVITLKITGEAPSNVSYATFAEFLKQSKGTIISDFKVDGYTYAPSTGRVTFSVQITVPPDLVKFPKS